MNNKKIKILHTPIRFYPAIGGVENHVLNLAKNLDKNQFTVRILCANEPSSTVKNIDGITVKRFPYIFKLTNTNIYFFYPLLLIREDFDIIHTHMPTPWTADWSILIAKIKKKKSIITIHNDMDKHGFLPKLITNIYLYSMFLMTLFFADRIIVVNTDWEKSYKNTKNILALFKKKITTIPNGVDTTLFIPQKKKIKHLLLFVSLLDKYHYFKGLDFLIHAIPRLKKRIPDIHLQIIGEGELKDYYIRMVKRKGLTKYISFLGEIPQNKLAVYYAQAELFILPSVDIEGFGIVALEALSSQTPVIATDIVGVSKDILQYKLGVVVPPKNPYQIAKAIERLLQNTKELAQMGKRGRNLVTKQYSWENIAKITTQVYQNV